MANASEWRDAFARQARADWRSREVLLTEPELPASQELHFLQMACEKLAKAQRYQSGADPQDIQSSHAHTRTQLPIILRETYQRYQGGRANAWLTGEFRRIANEIALLHPSIDSGGARPDNCEYPWEDV